jgi:SAM-dependent methyltransferase
MDAQLLRWHETWDAHQEAWLPGRRECFAHIGDLIAALTPHRPPRVLDLAGGIGSLTRHILAICPSAHVTLLDADPVVLAIAQASLGETVNYQRADLRDRLWWRHVDSGYDLIVAAGSLHCLDEADVAAVYAEVAALLERGGVFINADRMVDSGIGSLSGLMQDQRARQAQPADLWRQWWQEIADHPRFAEFFARRHAMPLPLQSAEFTPPASWHLGALEAAGFTEFGLLWRNPYAATVAAVS